MIRTLKQDSSQNQNNKKVNDFLEASGSTDALKELEEAMEMLENLEVVDPHMSKENFEDLKRKHRASENKAITKANMEYLKDMIKHELGKAGSPSDCRIKHFPVIKKIFGEFLSYLIFLCKHQKSIVSNT